MLYLKLFCYDYESVVLKGWKNYWDYNTDYDEKKVVVDESCDLSEEGLESLNNSDKKKKVIEIMNLMVSKCITEPYVILGAEITEEFKNDIAISFDGLKELYPIVHSIEKNVETYLDDNNDEKSIHLCWLEFPYVCDASDCGYFHFEDLKEFNKWINRCHIMTDDDIKEGSVSSLNYEEFNGVELSPKELSDKVKYWRWKKDQE